MCKEEMISSKVGECRMYALPNSSDVTDDVDRSHQDCTVNVRLNTLRFCNDTRFRKLKISADCARLEWNPRMI